jgi:hypothetical protein
MMCDCSALAILGVMVAMSACGGGTQTGGTGTGTGTGSSATTSLSKDDAVLEAVLLHEIAASNPKPDETLCLRVRGGPGDDASPALLAAIQHRHPKTAAGSQCSGGGPSPVRVTEGNGPGIMFDVGPVKWLGATALVEGGGGSRGGAASVREVEYRVELVGGSYKVVSERVLRQI